MFSKELENLIQATLEDGVLEEYEKAALVKRAAAEGVDLAELEIYINSILQKRQRELNEKKNAEFAQAEQQKKEAFGRVCPACGKQVEAMTLRCECGYEFTDNAARKSSIELLQEKLFKLSDTNSKVQTITMFPVPTIKEDIIDFLSTSAAMSKFSKSIGKELQMFYSALNFGLFPIDKEYKERKILSKAWRAKFKQVMLKARSLRGDSEFTQQLDYYENIMNKK